jgi:phosphoribosylformylglycinamidine synthase PurS subunit
MRFAATVEVAPLPGVADPEGATIARALRSLGYESLGGVRVGKTLRLHFDAADAEAARSMVEEMCRRLLVNPVIEEASIDVVEVGGRSEAKRTQ